jgi:hypothetical protein
MMRPSLRDSDIESQGARPVPKEFNPTSWIIAAVAVGIVAWAIWLM